MAFKAAPGRSGRGHLEKLTSSRDSHCSELFFLVCTDRVKPVSGLWPLSPFRWRGRSPPGWLQSCPAATSAGILPSFFARAFVIFVIS